MTYITRLIYALIFTAFILGCPDEAGFNPDKKLAIINSSQRRVVEYRQYSRLNDTILQESSPFNSQEAIEASSIRPGEAIEIPEESERIVRFGALHLFIIDEDTLRQVPWERIRDDYLVLRRYDLTLEDLEAMDWTIEYP